MAVLQSGTTIGGYTAVHSNNISTYALTSVPATISPTNIYVGNAIYFGGANNYFNWDGARINSNVGIQSTSDMRAPIFYDSADTAYYVDPNSTSSLNRIVTAGRLEVTYNTDRYQMNFYRASASNWWVANDSDKLGLHLNNVGDRFYFSTDGDLWSSTNGWLSTALGLKQNASTAITTSNIGSQSVNYASSAGNADTVDGRHADYFYPSSTDNGYSTGDINGNTTHQRLWGTDSVQDLVQFNAPTTVEYSTDGTNWVSTTVPTDVFTGKVYGAWGGMVMNVGNNRGGWRYVRMTWVNFGYRFFSHFTIAHSTNGHSFNFVFQKSDLDGNNFTEAFRKNGISSWPGYTFAKHSNVSGWWDTRDIRLVFELNHNPSFPDNAIQVGHIGIMGSYGSFTRLYDWDYNRNVTFANVIYASGGNSSQWNTAYSWGNHASAGYQAAATAITTSNIGSQSVNYASSAGSVAWTNVSSRPTALSQFTNDLGNYGGWYSASGGTVSGTITLPQNPVGTTYGSGVAATPPYMLYQGTGDNDGMRIYSEAGSTNQVRMVFELIDDIEEAYADQWVFRNKKTYGDYFARNEFQVSGDGHAQARSSLRAPIFYDSENTGYYLDPNSTSNLNTVYAGTLYGSDVYTTGGWFRNHSNSNGIYWSTSGWHLFPANSADFRFHSGHSSESAIRMETNGTTRGYVYVDSANQIGFLNDSRFWSLRVDNSGNSWATSSFRAPIFYDSQDSTYYLDPNSTGTSLNIAGVINTVAPSGSVLLKHSVSEADAWIFQENAANWGLYWKNNSAGNHSFGSYTTVGAELVGMSAINSSGNAVQTSNFTGATGAYGTWMLSNYNGYIWSSSTIQAASSMRAPIFYDSNDTGYYLDPNGTSNLNQISASTSARWGRSGNYWTVRPSIHSGVGYWTGTNGWGTGEGTWANAWKGGFSGWDIWGTGTDHPQGSGYVHAQGIVSGIHYTSTDGGEAYGWMMVGAADAITNRYWLRGKWGTTVSAWTEIMTSNQNTYAWNMDQWVRTTDSVSFVATTSPTFLVNSHSDNTKGYRLYNTSNSSVSAMFTNSSNYLVIGAGAFARINLNKDVHVNGVSLGVGTIAPSGTVGRIDASNDIVAYSSSDERLKYNITPIENAIDKVKSLTGVEFDWKPEYKHAHGYEGHDTGIIAQQVQEVIPSAVRTNDTGFLAVRYEKLIGLLVEGMKEQQAQIEELKAKLDGLTK